MKRKDLASIGREAEEGQEEEQQERRGGGLNEEESEKEGSLRRLRHS